MGTLNLEDVLDEIVARDARYDRAAYLFVRDALAFTQKRVHRAASGPPRHVTGQELLEGIRTYALEQFGPMAKLVLNEWGVQVCEDFGEIVFNMVDAQVLAKTDRDSREDFRGGYDFDEAFCQPFRPSAARRSSRSSKPTRRL